MQKKEYSVFFFLKVSVVTCMHGTQGWISIPVGCERRGTPGTVAKRSRANGALLLIE